MIVWGGSASYGDSNTGSRYNPLADSWSDTISTGAPNGRSGHTAVWAGNERIVFGGIGNDGNTEFGDTYSYAPMPVMYLYLN